MQFTPQQLAGAQRYGPRTRVGNWQEDCILEEAKIADFRPKREQGKLMLGRRDVKIKTSQQQVRGAPGHKEDQRGEGRMFGMPES